MACLAGILVQILPLLRKYVEIRKGLNDFPALYLAPRALSTGSLYGPLDSVTEEKEILTHVSPAIRFIRLPFVAVLLRPLSWMSYENAYLVWQSVSFLALAFFVWVWPARRMLSILICCWFPPVALNFANAQDVTFMLLWIAITARLVLRKSDLAAGVVLALCSAKFHLCIFLPVLIVAKRMWRFGAGLTLGCVALLGISFAAAGPDWPAAYLSLLRSPVIHPGLTSSSVIAMAARVMGGLALWIFTGALVAVIAAAVYWTGTRYDFPVALGAAFAGALVVGFHVYVQDYLLALPLLLTLMDRKFERDLAERSSTEQSAVSGGAC